MTYRIATLGLLVTCEPSLEGSLSGLSDYTVEDASSPEVRLDLRRFRFPESRIPEHTKEYSGFLTRKGREADKDAFVFCFREGKLLFGMQRETDGAYNAYIHAQTVIACKTALQYALLLEGCGRGILGMHCVTLSHEGRVMLFSAPSGTGKTTHTELWKRELGAQILNGDFAFLECREDGALFHGTPFSGSSSYAEKGVWRVDDIVFLKQSPENRIAPISRMAAAANAMENCFVPTWDGARTRMCLDLIGRLLKNTRVWRMECNMQPDAALVAQGAIFGGDT